MTYLEFRQVLENAMETGERLRSLTLGDTEVALVLSREALRHLRDHGRDLTLMSCNDFTDMETRITLFGYPVYLFTEINDAADIVAAYTAPIYRAGMRLGDLCISGTGDEMRLFSLTNAATPMLSDTGIRVAPYMVPWAELAEPAAPWEAAAETIRIDADCTPAVLGDIGPFTTTVTAETISSSDFITNWNQMTDSVSNWTTTIASDWPVNTTSTDNFNGTFTFHDIDWDNFYEDLRRIATPYAPPEESETREEEKMRESMKEIHDFLEGFRRKEDTQ